MSSHHININLFSLSLKSYCTTTTPIYVAYNGKLTPVPLVCTQLMDSMVSKQPPPASRKESDTTGEDFTSTSHASVAHQNMSFPSVNANGFSPSSIYLQPPFKPSENSASYFDKNIIHSLQPLFPISQIFSIPYNSNFINSFIILFLIFTDLLHIQIY